MLVVRINWGVCIWGSMRDGEKDILVITSRISQFRKRIQNNWLRRSGHYETEGEESYENGFHDCCFELFELS